MVSGSDSFKALIEHAGLQFDDEFVVVMVTGIPNKAQANDLSTTPQFRLDSSRMIGEIIVSDSDTQLFTLGQLTVSEMKNIYREATRHGYECKIQAVGEAMKARVSDFEQSQ